ncbi:MAG: integrase family protein [Zoogloeaceae bacterium]|nr:integrase family protein [Zoogloeaceae bacterium]
MPRTKLTAGQIRDFTCPKDKAQVFLWDTGAPGLAVRATPGSTTESESKGKAYIFQGKLDNKDLRATIGDVRVWNLDAARAEARRLQTLLDQGIDPRELDREKKEAKAAAEAAQEAARTEAERRARYTLRALCDAYTEHLERTDKSRSAAATRSAFKCHVFTHPEIAELPARDVSAHQVAALVRKVREAGKERAAGILRSYLSAAYNAAKRAPFDSALPADLIPFGIEHSPVDAIPAIAVQRGDRTLSSSELRDYIKALGDELPDVALRLALFAGGQRMAQLLRAKVSDFNPDTATLRLLDGKGKRTAPREHLLPLAPKAAAMVAGLVERAKGKDSTFLFSTHGKVPLAFTTPGKRVVEICASMGAEHFDLKDIRRTVETELAAMGISRDTRAQLMSHGISGVQAAHYDRHTYTDEKRAALAAWEARLDAIENGTTAPANVVKLRTA